MLFKNSSRDSWFTDCEIEKRGGIYFDINEGEYKKDE